MTVALSATQVRPAPGTEPIPQLRTRTERAAGKVVVAYVLLWLLEGALRKWGPPGLGPLLYFLRDGFMFLTLLAFSAVAPAVRRVPRVLPYLEVATCILCAVQMMVSTLPIQVAVVGVRQFAGPLLFIHFCAKYASTEEVRRISSLLMAFVPVECALSLAQVLSSPTSMVNAVGPDEYTGFRTSGDIVRASGTFTAAYGLVCFLMIVVTIALSRQAVVGPRALLDRISLPLILLTSLISGSRSAIYFVLLAVLAQAFFAFRSAEPKFKRAVIRTFSAMVLGILVAVWSAPAVLSAFQDRAENAEQTQSTSDRLALQAFRFTEQLPVVTWLGDGLGTHSAGGIAAGSTKDWIEDELGRWMREAGFLGIALVIARECSIPVLLSRSYCTSRHIRSSQCFLLASILSPNLAMGIINTQPSQQGFIAIAGVLTLLDYYAAKDAVHE